VLVFLAIEEQMSGTTGKRNKAKKTPNDESSSSSSSSSSSRERNFSDVYHKSPEFKSDLNKFHDYGQEFAGYPGDWSKEKLEKFAFMMDTRVKVLTTGMRNIREMSNPAHYSRADPAYVKIETDMMMRMSTTPLTKAGKYISFVTLICVAIELFVYACRYDRCSKRPCAHMQGASRSRGFVYERWFGCSRKDNAM
jgi:hypothetical protein